MRGRCLLQVHLGGAGLGDMEHVQRDPLGHGQWHPIHNKTAKKSKQRKENAKKKEDKKSDRAIGRYVWCLREGVSACSGGTEGRPGPAYGGRVPSRCQTWQVATCPQCLSRTQTHVRVSIATGMGWEHCTAARSPRTRRRARAAAASAASLSKTTLSTHEPPANRYWGMHWRKARPPAPHG